MAGIYQSASRYARPAKGQIPRAVRQWPKPRLERDVFFWKSPSWAPGGLPRSQLRAQFILASDFCLANPSCHSRDPYASPTSGFGTFQGEDIGLVARRLGEPTRPGGRKPVGTGLAVPALRGGQATVSVFATRVFDTLVALVLASPAGGRGAAPRQPRSTPMVAAEEWPRPLVNPFQWIHRELESITRTFKNQA